MNCVLSVLPSLLLLAEIHLTYIFSYLFTNAVCLLFFFFLFAHQNSCLTKILLVFFFCTCCLASFLLLLLLYLFRSRQILWKTNNRTIFSLFGLLFFCLLRYSLLSCSATAYYWLWCSLTLCFAFSPSQFRFILLEFSFLSAICSHICFFAYLLLFLSFLSCLLSLLLPVKCVAMLVVDGLKCARLGRPVYRQPPLWIVASGSPSDLLLSLYGDKHFQPEPHLFFLAFWSLICYLLLFQLLFFPSLLLYPPYLLLSVICFYPFYFLTLFFRCFSAPYLFFPAFLLRLVLCSFTRPLLPHFLSAYFIDTLLFLQSKQWRLFTFLTFGCWARFMSNSA